MNEQENEREREWEGEREWESVSQIELISYFLWLLLLLLPLFGLDGM